MRQGFSLVELSIVLVILGLLTGGVLTGQNLIRAAELRSVSTEYAAYQTAVNTFRDKYFGIPGDLRNANSFWTAAANGNGDGLLNNPAASANAPGEIFGFWEQLALAGMVEGTYDGLAGANASGLQAIPADNVPKSKLGNGGWSVLNVADQAITSVTYYEGSYGNVFFLGNAAAADISNVAILPAEETWNIDTKLDDGNPDRGLLRTLESQGNATAGSGCGDLAAAATALVGTVDYDLANTTATCTLIFKM